MTGNYTKLTGWLENAGSDWYCLKMDGIAGLERNGRNGQKRQKNS